MDGHRTGLSALAHNRNKLQELLVLHTSPDISILGGSVSSALLSLPDLHLHLIRDRAATRMVSNRRALRSDGVVARTAGPPLWLCRTGF